MVSVRHSGERYLNRLLKKQKNNSFSFTDVLGEKYGMVHCIQSDWPNGSEKDTLIPHAGSIV